MEHNEKNEISVQIPVTPVTPASSPSMATSPDRAASKQQKKKQQRQQPQQPSTPKSPKSPRTPQLRRANTSDVSTPNSCNTKTTTSSPQKSTKWFRRPGHKRSVTDSRSFDQIQAEHLYLFSNLQQQEARIRTLVAALATVQSQLQLPSTMAEARRLRKNAGFIKSKISDAEQQERLALIGIGHVSAELQSRYRHLHLHQHLHLQQEHIAHFYDHLGHHDHHEHHGHQDHENYGQDSQVPDTPYLVPQQGFEANEGNADEKYTGMSEIPTISPKSWEERRSGGEAEFMSPMSPLAPVFQPRASFLFGPIHTATNSGGIDHVMANAAADDAAKQESLGGTTFAGEADADDSIDKVAEAKVDVKAIDFTPRSVPEEELSAKENKDTGVGIAGMHYVFDAHGKDAGVDGVDGGDSDDSDEFMPREIRTRRGSHDGKHAHQHAKPLTPAREKRMSLPPVRFSWPEKEE